MSNERYVPVVLRGALPRGHYAITEQTRATIGRRSIMAAVSLQHLSRVSPSLRSARLPLLFRNENADGIPPSTHPRQSTTLLRLFWKRTPVICLPVNQGASSATNGSTILMHAYYTAAHMLQPTIFRD